MSRDKPSTIAGDGSTAIKHHLTEEVFDLYVNRRLAAWVVHVLLPTPISANHVTVAAAILGIFSGLLIAQGTTAACGWAAVCLLLSMILDCADGQLARARGGGSRFGRLLDGASDYTNATALHLGMWAYLATDGVLFRNRLVDGWGLFAWVGLAGLSMALHSSHFDFRKQWFLAHLRPDVAEADSVDELSQELAELDNPFVKGMLGFYILYTRVQQHLRRDLDDQGISEITDPAKRAVYQDRCAPFLRTAGLIGPTTHNVLIGLAMVAAPFFPQAFWWYVLTVSVPMNLVFVGLFFWGRRLDTEFDGL
jgi:hypothetical protein